MSFATVFQLLFFSVKTVAIPFVGRNVVAERPQTIASEIEVFLRSTFTADKRESPQISVENVWAAKYSFSLVRPMRIRPFVSECREGILVTIDTDAGTSSVGYICPLRAVHTERCSVLKRNKVKSLLDCGQ